MDVDIPMFRFLESLTKTVSTGRSGGEEMLCWRGEQRSEEMGGRGLPGESQEPGVRPEEAEQGQLGAQPTAAPSLRLPGGGPALPPNEANLEEGPRALRRASSPSRRQEQC